MKGKGKGKFHPRTGHEGPEWEMYISTLPLTSALEGVGVERHAPAALPPGKTWYTISLQGGTGEETRGSICRHRQETSPLQVLLARYKYSKQ